MKKTILIMIFCSLVLSLASCGKDTETLKADETMSETTTVSETSTETTETTTSAETTTTTVTTSETTLTTTSALTEKQITTSAPVTPVTTVKPVAETTSAVTTAPTTPTAPVDTSKWLSGIEHKPLQVNVQANKLYWGTTSMTQMNNIKSELNFLFTNKQAFGAGTNCTVIEFYIIGIGLVG